MQQSINHAYGHNAKKSVQNQYTNLLYVTFIKRKKPSISTFINIITKNIIKKPIRV